MSQAPPDPAQAERLRLAGTGMTVSLHAKEAPERPAIISDYGDRTFGQLNAKANQLGRALRARGLGEGDAAAILCRNRAEFAEVWAATQRTGIRLTPINWHLGADEVAYIVNDCEAKAFIADARCGTASEAVKLSPNATSLLAVGGDIPGFDSYDSVIEKERENDIEDPVLGTTMLYTSGTTGRPKGVFRAPRARGQRGASAASGDSQQPDQQQQAANLIGLLFGYKPGEDLHICTGPLYHSAPAAFSLTVPLGLGVGTVLMDGWDPELMLSLIEKHRVTHTHLVPTMFHRLLQLPEETKKRFDTSSLRYILHGAAPCPAHVKQGIMDWLGPIVYEYYAATEGWGTFVTPDEWLKKPGTVGKPREGQVEIRSDDGTVLPAGEVGLLYLRSNMLGRFEYYNDPEKTESVYDGEMFTLGDMGYFDDEGYLFLTDRTADLIISGGVNIYPAEVDGVLLSHPAVGDVATIGVPNEEWGEEVKSVVELRAGVGPSDELAKELIEYARENLAHYKCPKTIDFVEDLPRAETGKIYRRLVREKYWAGRKVKI